MHADDRWPSVWAATVDDVGVLAELWSDAVRVIPLRANYQPTGCHKRVMAWSPTNNETKLLESQSKGEGISSLSVRR
jgi:hypothetical protein